MWGNPEIAVPETRESPRREKRPMSLLVSHQVALKGPRERRSKAVIVGLVLQHHAVGN